MSEALNFRMKNPELYETLIEDVYRFMKKIDWLENFKGDEKHDANVRQAVSEEIEFQKKDLDELKSLMKNNKDGFVRIIYYKYVEGYSLNEVVDELNSNYGTVANNHAEFSSYLNTPKEERERPKVLSGVEFRRMSENLKQSMEPTYEACCSHCGNTTMISSELVKKIVSTEVNKERSWKRFNQGNSRRK